MGWMEKEYWTTKVGEKIYPKDMADGHLINTISFIEKKAPTLKMQHELSMYALPEPMGDGAQMCFEAECIRLERMSIQNWLKCYCNIYNLLLEEKLKRTRA